MQRSQRVFSIILLMIGLFSVSVMLPTAGAQAACADETDYLALGEAQFEAGDYAAAAEAFACAAEVDPVDLDAYRGQIEAHLYGGQYAAALQTFTAFRIHVIPEQPDAFEQVIAAYAAALEDAPDDVRLLTGYSFTLWYLYETQAGLEVIEHLLELEPDQAYARLFRGSSHYFLGDSDSGDLDFAVALEAQADSADVYFIVADASLYGAGDVEGALEFALKAQELGLDSPRLNAILGSAYFALGEQAPALEYFGRHIETATVETITGEALEAGAAISIDILPGQTYAFPVMVAAGETISLVTTSSDDVDSIMVLATEDGTLVTGNDDSEGFNAGFAWTADKGGTYILRLSTFEGSGTGNIVLTRG